MDPVSSTPQEAKRKAVYGKLLDHNRWFWTLFFRPNLLAELIPWPLLWLFRKTSKAEHSNGSAWATMTVVWTGYLIYYSGANADLEARYASDGSRTLFTGAFLLGTLLGLTNTAAGTAIKRSIEEDAASALEVGATFAWGLLFGLVGATALMFYGSLYPAARWVAILLGVFGGFMEVNLMLYTLRMVLLGWVEKPPAGKAAG